jgi:CBS domain containing-hemolysin-like protein
MDSNSLLLIVVLIILIVFSGLFSATETAYSSMNRIRLMSRADEGDQKAEAVLEAAKDFDKLLSTILIGNNIVNISAASISTVLFTRYWKELGPTLSTIVLTIVVLIFAEISPKSLAKESPERFAVALLPVLRFFMTILTPLTALFSLWKKLLHRVFHLSDETGITEEELITMVDQAETEGGLDEDESDLIRAAIEFNDLEVSEILIPRVDITAVEDTASMEELSALFAESGYSRIPVFHETIDNIIGVIHEKDLHVAIHRGETQITNVITQVLFVSATTKISDLLRILQKKKCHMVIVLDEYGGTDGLATLEDILEELVGEIWDEHDEVIEEFQKQEDGSYLISCSANLEDLFEHFELDEEDFDCTTVSGWVLAQVGRLPDVGDHFVYENLDVTVTRVENRRVLEIRVVVLDQEESKDE